MWPYLVGIEGMSQRHAQAKLALFDAKPVIRNVWMVHSDYPAEALRAVLRALLPDQVRFFVAPVENEVSCDEL